MHERVGCYQSHCPLKLQEDRLKSAAVAQNIAFWICNNTQRPFDLIFTIVPPVHYLIVPPVQFFVVETILSSLRSIPWQHDDDFNAQAARRRLTGVRRESGRGRGRNLTSVSGAGYCAGRVNTRVHAEVERFVRWYSRHTRDSV